MNLYQKIMFLYPQLVDNDFASRGSITLQNDSDGKGDYIAFWNHPTFARPTDAQLAEIN